MVGEPLGAAASASVLFYNFRAASKRLLQPALAQAPALFGSPFHHGV